jgi:hypothetical protein
MDRIKVANELVRLAKSLMAMEFDTDAEMKKYKQDHDVRPGTKLTVKKTEEKKPAGGSKIHPNGNAFKRVLDKGGRGGLSKEEDAKLQDAAKVLGSDDEDIKTIGQVRLEISDDLKHADKKDSDVHSQLHRQMDFLERLYKQTIKRAEYGKENPRSLKPTAWQGVLS